jgi:hypothetical protein
MASLYDRLSALALTFRTTDYWHIMGGIAILLVVYNFVLIVYRLWFSPLAGFPGPKLLAATTWYETLIDLWSHDFPERLSKIHGEYGENPGSGHILDRHPITFI